MFSKIGLPFYTGPQAEFNADEHDYVYTSGKQV